MCRSSPGGNEDCASAVGAGETAGGHGLAKRVGFGGGDGRHIGQGVAVKIDNAHARLHGARRWGGNLRLFRRGFRGRHSRRGRRLSWTTGEAGLAAGGFWKRGLGAAAAAAGDKQDRREEREARDGYQPPHVAVSGLATMAGTILSSLADANCTS